MGAVEVIEKPGEQDAARARFFARSTEPSCCGRRLVLRGYYQLDVGYYISRSFWAGYATISNQGENVLSLISQVVAA